MVIENEKDLGKALKDKQDTIEIHGDLKSKVVRIKATGKVAWAVAMGAIVIAVVSILSAPATVGSSTAVNFITVPVAIGVLGGATAVSAISIAVAAGGVGALNKLRKYKIDRNDDDALVLIRK